jgi:glyoxylase-like metal-dependent hydrolase (beta-lactamase superfamily II)
MVGTWAGGSWAYVVAGTDATVLVDAGGAEDGAALLDALASVGRVPADVSAVLLTHAHADHVAALARFPGAVTFVGAADHLLLRRDVAPQGAWWRVAAHLRRPAPLNQRIRSVLPGSLLHFGALEVEVIALPGHTEGSLAYRVGDVLFCGDAIVRAGDRLEVVAADGATAQRSLRRLAGVAFDGIANGHNGFTADGRARLKLGVF